MISNTQTTHQGFTLIELVMVLVVISLLSYSGISLFTSQSVYAGFVAKDVLISQTLLAQQVALASSGVTNPVSLTLSVNSDDDWVFAIQKTGVTNPPSIVVESSGNDMQVDGVTFSSGDSQTFTWNNSASFSDGASHTVRFTGQNSFRVCLSEQGYAYESAVVCP
jgi:prepilin-type N-terminal cleavage/methylation domain-containing protein